MPAPSINVPGLRDWIAVEGARLVVWGVNDCCLFAADWVLGLTGIDPAARWRGTYRSEREAHRKIKAAGGFLAAIGPEMDRAGFARTDDPTTGDVGIVEAPVAIRKGTIITRPVAAIRVGKRWAVKSSNGIAADADFVCLAAWSIPPKEENP